MRKTYVTVSYFEDLMDDNHPYNVGDPYPREGYKASEDRIRELASPFNLRQTILIEEVKPVVKAGKISEE